MESKLYMNLRYLSDLSDPKHDVNKGSQVIQRAKASVVIVAIDYVNLELSFQVIEPRQNRDCLFRSEAVAEQFIFQMVICNPSPDNGLDIYE